MKKFLALAFALILVLTTLTACGGSSDGTKEAGGTTWPSKGAVTVTVPYSAGGDTDTYCRALFKLVGEDLKQKSLHLISAGSELRRRQHHRRFRRCGFHCREGCQE